MRTASFGPSLRLLGTCWLLITVLPAPGADLVATAFSLSGEPVSARSVQLEWRVENVGGATLTSWWYDGIYFSTNNTWDAADSRVVNDYQSLTLAPGGNYARTATITLPEVPEGRYRLILRIDHSDAINETNELNNERVISIDIVVPDLVVADFRVLSGGLAEGSVTLGCIITNEGTGTAKSWWYDRVYFSTDAVWGVEDLQLDSTYQSRVLAPGGSYGRTNTFTLPPDAPGGSCLILRCDATDAVIEGTETNNTAVLALGQSGLAPRLVIRWAPPKVELYWPTSAVGFIVQSTPRLGLSAAWTALTNPVANSGTNFLSGVDPIESPEFFRLMRE